MLVPRSKTAATRWKEGRRHALSQTERCTPRPKVSGSSARRVFGPFPCQSKRTYLTPSHGCFRGVRNPE